MNCILCDAPADNYTCPRCKKPLCAKHGTNKFDGAGGIVLRPDENCRVPLPVEGK